MAIGASGVFGQTLSKQLQDTLGKDQGSETLLYGMLVTDGYTPDYDAHDFRADVTNEVSGGGYSAGGNLLTGTTLTVSTNGTLIYDVADESWPSSTITDAMALVGYFTTGAAATDEILWLSDFVTAASSSNGTFTVQWSTGGVIIYDFTP